MALNAYGLDVFNFEFWQGPAPGRVQDHGRVFTKPGSDNIGLEAFGFYGNPFDVTLTSWWPADGSGDVANGPFSALVYNGRLALVYNYINYTTAYGLWFHVLDFQPLSVNRIPYARRAGAGGVVYFPCDVNVSRWTLQPEYIDPTP